MARVTIRFGVILALPLLIAAAPASITTPAGTPIAGTIEGQPVSIHLETGAVGRIVLSQATATRLGLKPAMLMGKASLQIGPTRVLKGHNRPADIAFAGAATNARVLWFDDTEVADADASVGPWGLPHDRVIVTLPGAGTTPYRFSLFGDRDQQSYSAVKGSLNGQDFGFGLVLATEKPYRFPLASAATGAAIANSHGGIASTETWDEEILYGIRRPVRRVDLATPLVVGPFRFSTIAVRVRDGRDGMGSGAALPRPPEPGDDPSEITVTATTEKGPRPVTTLTIGAPALAACSRIEFAKAAREIRLVC